MPKVLQMPKREPSKAERTNQLAKLLAGEVESPKQADAKIHKWLELGDAALEDAPKVEIIVRTS